ncbi:hypothetical protein SLOPH_907 [Spraguea lophii 42_110]|uniref:Uncharacterized protein n=1 Tax=Spraguea lophii (strain 42_110) TaxID=1358809 RepID=S7XVY6_SPRLO|nr:hypothetical protein SLOPH_907 [Spraguea lophii 42_110]
MLFLIKRNIFTYLYKDYICDSISVTQYNDIFIYLYTRLYSIYTFIKKYMKYNIMVVNSVFTQKKVGFMILTYFLNVCAGNQKLKVKTKNAQISLEDENGINKSKDGILHLNTEMMFSAEDEEISFPVRINTLAYDGIELWYHDENEQRKYIKEHSIYNGWKIKAIDEDDREIPSDKLEIKSIWFRTAIEINGRLCFTYLVIPTHNKNITRYGREVYTLDTFKENFQLAINGLQICLPDSIDLETLSFSFNIKYDDEANEIIYTDNTSKLHMNAYYWGKLKSKSGFENMEIFRIFRNGFAYTYNGSTYVRDWFVPSIKPDSVNANTPSPNPEEIKSIEKRKSIINNEKGKTEQEDKEKELTKKEDDDKQEKTEQNDNEKENPIQPKEDDNKQEKTKPNDDGKENPIQPKKDDDKQEKTKPNDDKQEKIKQDDNEKEESSESTATGTTVKENPIQPKKVDDEKELTETSRESLPSMNTFTDESQSLKIKDDDTSDNSFLKENYMQLIIILVLALIY